MDLFDQSLTIMEKSLDLRMANQRLVASNLANIDTPGFKAQKMDFEASMDAAIRGIEAAESGDLVATPSPVIEESKEASLTLDGNNVNLEEEMSQLSRNKMMYSVTSQIMAAKMRQLATVISSQT